MSNQYTINQIASICEVSKQSLYKLIGKNRPFIANNSTRRQRVIYYNETALDFFISYYKPEHANEKVDFPSAVNVEEEKSRTEEIVSHSPQTENPPSVGSREDAQIDDLRDQIDALHAQIDALGRQLDAKEAERKELFHQNSQLLLLLQQLQQQNMLLLPAPKKSFTDKIKSIFKSKPQEK